MDACRLELYYTMSNSHKRVGATGIKHGLVKTPTIWHDCPTRTHSSFARTASQNRARVGRIDYSL
jgi:hypothetical protein